MTRVVAHAVQGNPTPPDGVRSVIAVASGKVTIFDPISISVEGWK